MTRQAERVLDQAITRRTFVKLSGLTVGGMMAAGVGLSACGGDAQTAAPTEAATDEPPEPTPAESSSAPADTEAGAIPLTGKRVGIASPITVEILEEFYADMRAEAALPENGEEIVVVDANGDSTTQHTQVDAFIAQEFDAIVMLVLTVEGWADTVGRATERGIGVFNHSASAIGGCTQNVGLDQFAGGSGPGQFAAEWINQNHGGEADVGVLAILNDPQLRLRGEGFRSALEEFAPGARIVQEVHAQTRDEGAAAAANLLQANPDIKVIYAAGDDPGLGALTAATEAGRTDPNDFFIGSSDGTDAVFEQLGKGGIYQCTWSFLFPFSATQLERDVEKFLRGETVQPTRIMIGELVNQSNLEEFETLLSDPRAPDVQSVYTERMTYSDVALKTGQPFLEALS